MMLAARGAIRASGAGLPYDAEVEYLESTGTQYIDTGFKANTTTTRLDIELMLTQGTANMGLFGSRNASGTSSSSSCNAFFMSANQAFRMDWAKGSGSFFNCSQNTAYSISITGGSMTINGSTTTYSGRNSVDQANNFLIFTFAEGAGVVYQNGMIGRVFGAKIYSNNLLVRDYIPVRKKTVGYLYDRVSGKLFGNAGTGAFTYGNDLKYPIPA